MKVEWKNETKFNKRIFNYSECTVPNTKIFLSIRENVSNYILTKIIFNIKLNRIHQIFNKLFRATSLLLLLLLFYLMEPVMAFEGQYNEQGNALDKAMHRELIRRGLCTVDYSDFTRKVPAYGAYGNHVNLSIYKPDRKALAAIFEFLVLHGVEITKGVQISIRVYPKSRKEYGNIVFSPKPTIQLEIKE